MHNKTKEQILQEKVYGKAAVATAEDEENDEYDDFDAGSLDLPFTNKMGYLEYSKDMNLSPVSCLTTLSSGIRDNSQITEEQDYTGPGKALHSGGVSKRLPLDDEVDSDEDDSEDDGQGQGQASNEEDKPRSSQDLSSAGKGDSKSTSNTTTSSGNRSTNSNSNTNTNSESNMDKTASVGNSSSYNSNKDFNKLAPSYMQLPV